MFYKNFVFIMPERTASSTISRILLDAGGLYLGEKCGVVAQEGLIDKPRFYHIQRFIPAEELAQCTVIGFVRNPWARMVSFLERRRYEYETDGVVHDCPLEMKELLLWIRDETGEHTQHRHYDGSYDFCKFYRFEDIPGSIRAVCREVGIQVDEIPKIAGDGPRPPYATYYTPETRRLVAEMEAPIIERFGYEFEE